MRLHAVGGLDAEGVQAQLQDAGGEVAEADARRAGRFLGLQHGAGLVEAAVVARQLEEVVAEVVGPVFLRHGFQHQTEVQELLGQRVDVVGASRTDTGVHAVGQVAAFSADVRVPVARLANAISARLPRDVQVVEAEQVSETFNPIGDARSKCYRYTIEHTSHPHNPWPLFDRNFVFSTPHTLDLDRMQRAASLMVGTYDCASFTQVDHGRTTTVRSVYDCVVRSPAPRRVEIEICASGFLYNMVRIVAGTLFEVGRGRIEPSAITEIRDARDRTRAGPTLPPQGLCLRWIWYGAPRMKVGESAEGGDVVPGEGEGGLKSRADTNRVSTAE